MSNNCVPFAPAREQAQTGRRRRRNDVSALASGLFRSSAAPSLSMDHVLGTLTPAQYAFLTGVLALLAAHGEDALTKSCELVIARFGRGETAPADGR